MMIRVCLEVGALGSFRYGRSVVFLWMPQWNLARFRLESTRKHDVYVRVAYSTTQSRRLYLCIGPEGLKYTAHFKCENMWVPVRSNIRYELPAFTVDSSEQDIAEEMQFQLTRQFRETESGYYDESPSYEDVLSVLNCAPRLSTVVTNRLTYSHMDVDLDSGWDGALQIDCSGGYLQLPYRELPDGDLELLREFAKFVPDTPVIFQCIGNLINRVVEAVSNIHWSNIRSVLDSRR